MPRIAGLFKVRVATPWRGDRGSGRPLWGRVGLRAFSSGFALGFQPFGLAYGNYLRFRKALSEKFCLFCKRLKYNYKSSFSSETMLLVSDSWAADWTGRKIS